MPENNWSKILFHRWLDEDIRIPEGSVCPRCDQLMRIPEQMLVLAQRRDYYVDEDGKTINRTGVRFCDCPPVLEEKIRPRYSE